LGRRLVGIIAAAEPRTSVAGKDDSTTTRRLCPTASRPCRP